MHSLPAATARLALTLLATASLGATASSAAPPVPAAAPTAGSVGALTLERMPSLFSAGSLARARSVDQRRRDIDASLAERLARQEQANLAEFLAVPRSSSSVPAPADASVNTRTVEAAHEAAAFDFTATNAPAERALPADYAGAAYDLRPVSAEPIATASVYQAAGESFSAHAAAPNDYAASAAARPSVWTQAAASVVNAPSYFSAPSTLAPVAAPASSYAAWTHPALPGSGASSAASPFAGAVASVRSASPATGSIGQPAAGPVLVPFSLASSDGNASTQTASFGIAPSAGTNQFLLTTINPAGSVPTGYGTAPADTNVANLNAYFGLATGTLAGRGAADGSGYLSQTQTLGQGFVVSFDYVFLTDEDNTLSGFHNDQAFFTVNGVINSTLYQANQFSAAQLNNGSNTIFSFQTPGYVTVSYTVPAAGNYVFGFGVIDVGVNTIKSGLLVDNFGISAVPEPATWAGGGLLLGAAGLTLRRRLRRA